jgi:hypothetical protein
MTHKAPSVRIDNHLGTDKDLSGCVNDAANRPVPAARKHTLFASR